MEKEVLPGSCFMLAVSFTGIIGKFNGVHTDIFCQTMTMIASGFRDWALL